jgi:hypothetical protein
MRQLIFSTAAIAARSRWDQGLTAAEMKTLPLGQTGDGLPDQVHEMDAG